MVTSSAASNVRFAATACVATGNPVCASTAAHLLPVPRPTKKPTRRSQATQKVIEALIRDKVAVIRVPDGGNVRGIKVSLTHAAKRVGKLVKLWDVDEVVYAELADD
jgi:hypothetical protein